MSMPSNPFNSPEFRQRLAEFIELQNKRDQTAKDLESLETALSSASQMMQLNELGGIPHFTVTYKGRAYLFTIDYFYPHEEATCVKLCKEIETLS